MADFITNSLPSYTHQDALKYFYQPLIMGNTNINIYDVLYNVKSSQAISKLGAASKITKAYATGFSGVAGSTITQRTITVSRVQAELE